MKMKESLKKIKGYLIIGLFICLMSFNTACKPGKYFADFKSNKGSIDTLAIFQPYVSVLSISEKEQYEDIVLNILLRKYISEKTSSFLSSKYVLAPVEEHLDSIPFPELEGLLLVLDNSDKHLAEIQIPDYIQKASKDIKERYSMVIIFNGYYHAFGHPSTNLMLGYQSSAISISLRDLVDSQIRLIVFDHKKNNIVYYNYEKSRGKDPRTIDLIVGMATDIIKPIYYK